MSRGELTPPQISHALAHAFASLRERTDLSEGAFPSEEQLDRMTEASLTGKDSPEVRAFLRRWLTPSRRGLLEIQEGPEMIAELYGE